MQFLSALTSPVSPWLRMWRSGGGKVSPSHHSQSPLAVCYLLCKLNTNFIALHYQFHSLGIMGENVISSLKKSIPAEPLVFNIFYLFMSHRQARERILSSARRTTNMPVIKKRNCCGMVLSWYRTVIISSIFPSFKDAKHV